ncbi:hypothetical protein GEMRC1_007789 [Eukaryota sp. GEM-RC1]
MQAIATFIVKRRRIVFVFVALAFVLSAWLSTQVNINYDMSEYLPPDSDTTKALRIIREDYPELGGSLRLMVKDVDTDTALEIRQELENTTNVASVAFEIDDPAHYKDNIALFHVTLVENNSSPITDETIDYLEQKYSDKDVFLGGQAVLDAAMRSTVGELPIMMATAGIIVFGILALASASYMEPLVFAIVISCAIVINAGTNAIFEHVSFITQSIASVLILGLSMDYFIMLLNRYHQEEENFATKEDAMIRALSKSIVPISSSSLTTIAGMLALTQMSFLIGRDIGLVLAKGVLWALICVFLLLPGLMISFDKLCQKTKKRAFRVPASPFVKLATKTRGIITILTVILVAAAFYFSLDTEHLFSEVSTVDGELEIQEVFGNAEQVLFLHDRSNVSAELEAQFISEVQSLDHFLYHQSYYNTLGQPIVPLVLESFGFDPAMSQMFFYMFHLNAESLADDTESFQSMISFLANMEDFQTPEILEVDHLLSTLPVPVNSTTAAMFIPIPSLDEFFIPIFYTSNEVDFDYSKDVEDIKVESQSFDESTTIPLLDIFSEVNLWLEHDLVVLSESELEAFSQLFTLVSIRESQLDYTAFADILGMESSVSSFIYAQYFVVVDSRDVLPVPLLNMMLFINHTLNTMPMFADNMPEEQKQMLSVETEKMVAGKSNFIGDKTQRFIGYFDIDVEGEEVWELTKLLRSTAFEVFGEGSLITGNIVTFYDIKESFGEDELNITILTLGSIFTLILLAFRSFSIPVILVLIIQGAIWLNMSVSVFMDQQFYFLASLIIQAIQMGATIDYAILMTSSYVEKEENLPRNLL